MDFNFQNKAPLWIWTEKMEWGPSAPKHLASVRLMDGPWDIRFTMHMFKMIPWSKNQLHSPHDVLRFKSWWRIDVRWDHISLYKFLLFFWKKSLALFIWLIIRLIQLVFSAGTVFFSHKKSANSVFQPAYNSSRTAPNNEICFFVHPISFLTLPLYRFSLY
jgi:hypothetical protein